MTELGAALAGRRTLGWTGLEMAPLTLGTMQCGWTLSDVESMELFDRYVDAGGNVIDTANMYGPNQNWRDFQRCKPHLGVSEDILGRWMADRRNRDTLVVATKVRAPMWDGPDGEGLSPAHIKRAVEDSLRRLRTDYIDLYQAHWPDDSVPLEDTFIAFQGLVDSGKVRYIGVSNYAALGQLDAVLALAQPGAARIASEQLRFNLVNSAEFEGDIERTLAAHDMGVLSYSPLASGFLTGKHVTAVGAATSQRHGYVSQYLTKTGQQLIDELRAVAGHHGVSCAAVALAWILAHPGITSAVVGANSVEQLDNLLPAARVALQPEEFDRLSELGWATSRPEYTSW